MSEEKVTTESKVMQETKAPRAKIWPIVLSVLFICVIAFFTAFLHWHEEPSFCSTICHSNMQKYVDGYYSEDDALLVSKHAEADVTCLGCHWSQAKMLDLVHEVVMYVTDSYTDPLEDMREFNNDEFCGACHNGVEAKTKEEATAGLAYDPHNMPQIAAHEGVQIECGDCHAVHKVSTMACASCHDNMEIPEGWTVPAENEAKAAASAAMGIMNGHDIPQIEAHAAANITCGSCHDSKVMYCATCHANFVTEDSLPAGWTLPEVRVNAMGDHMTEVSMDQCATCHNGTTVRELDKDAVSAAYTWNGEPFDFHNMSEELIATHNNFVPDFSCNTCHAEKTVANCTTCHAGVFTTPIEGWEGIEVAEEPKAEDSASAPAASGELKDGTYEAAANGIGGKVPVTVEVKDGKIASVTVGENAETQGIGTKAIEQLPALIVEANGTAGVDAVSGASVTSQAILKGVDECIAQAQA